MVESIGNSSRISTMADILLLNPNIVTQKADIASSGIPYWPLTLAYAASYLKTNKFNVQVLDAFGENPTQIRQTEGAYIQGLTPKQVVDRILKIKPTLIISYAGTVMNHDAHLELLRAVKKSIPVMQVIVLENTQQVTSYKLEKIPDEFFNAGADYIYSGEPEKHLSLVIKNVIKKDLTALKKIPGLTLRNGKLLHSLPTDGPIWNLDSLPFPAWDLFPVQNYWDLGYSHGPKNHRKYLPLYTSRGCPFGCAFCTIPLLNNRLWRGRSGKNVAREMEHWYKKWGVKEFHIEDVNPALVGPRMIDLSREIIRRRLNINWKIVSGTKVEALTTETIQIMAKAGCNYISISPESGSPKMLKLMNKPFAHELALKLINVMHRSGITTQACFVLGFPGETDKDRKLTWDYVKRLAQNGLDEIAPFIMTPIPGSAQWGKKKGYKQLSELTFSPVWRSDFLKLHLFRLHLFIWFSFWRVIYNPLSIIKSFKGLITGKFFTKTEMTIHRLLKIRLWATFNAI